MRQQRRRATSLDVARESGVSRTTVSYVFSNHPRITEATRRRVLDVAARLDYQPFGPARVLRGGSSRVVLMVTPTITAGLEPIGASIVERLGQRLAARGLQLIWQLGIPGSDSIRHELTPQLVLSSADEDEPEIVDLRRHFDAPVLPAFPGLAGFIGGAGVAQAEHCHDRGHRRLAYAAPAEPLFRAASDLRLNAIRVTCRRLKLKAPLSVRIPWDRAATTTVLTRLLDRPDPPTAVCAYNDEVASVVLAAAADLEISVPDRLAVIGVDGRPWGEMLGPALSTVVAEVDDFVDAMADNVISVADGGAPTDVSLPTAFTVLQRRST